MTTLETIIKISNCPALHERWEQDSTGRKIASTEEVAVTRYTIESLINRIRAVGFEDKANCSWFEALGSELIGPLQKWSWLKLLIICS